MAVCSETHTKHVNTGQNVELLNVKTVEYALISKVLKGQSATTYRPTLLLHDLHISPNYLKGTITQKVRDT